MKNAYELKLTLLVFFSFSLTFWKNGCTLGSCQSSPDFLGLFTATSRVVPILFLTFVVSGFAVDADALPGSAMTAKTLVPIKRLNVGLLFLVCTHHAVVAAVWVYVFCFLISCRLRPRYQRWLEHVWGYSIPSLSSHNRWNKLCGDGVGFVVLVEGSIVLCHSFVGQFLWFYELRRWWVGVINSVRLTLYVELSSLPGSLQGKERRWFWCRDEHHLALRWMGRHKQVLIIAHGTGRWVELRSNSNCFLFGVFRGNLRLHA